MAFGIEKSVNLFLCKYAQTSAMQMRLQVISISANILMEIEKCQLQFQLRQLANLL